MWQTRALLLTFQVAGGVAVLGLYRIDRWGWISSVTVFGLVARSEPFFSATVFSEEL